eukprot:3579831-Prymnesium_polylepis.1
MVLLEGEGRILHRDEMRAKFASGRNRQFELALPVLGLRAVGVRLGLRWLPLIRCAAVRRCDGSDGRSRRAGFGRRHERRRGRSGQHRGGGSRRWGRGHSRCQHKFVGGDGRRVQALHAHAAVACAGDNLIRSAAALGPERPRF